MTTNIQPMMTFALAPDERMVHVDDVVTGLQCECICPGCHNRLVAKNAGREKTHHFAHEAGANQQGCAETALHLASKQIIYDYRRVLVPSLPPQIPTPTELPLKTVQLESRFSAANGDIVVDCYADSEFGPLAIEVAVHHLIDEAKAAKLQQLQLPTLEIDLSDMVTLPWAWNELEEAVLFEPTRRMWIHHAEVFDAETLVQPVPLQNAEWRFAVGNVWIWVKRLPFGNYKVYHRYDETTRRIVEPICRHRGYWHPGYNNWIVFEQFRDEVLDELSQKAKTL